RRLLQMPRPPTTTLLPSTTLFRSDPLADGEAEAGTGTLARAGARRVGPPEAVEDVRQVARRDADPRVRHAELHAAVVLAELHAQDRKSTRLNSSHGSISYAVFCLK